MKIKDLHEFLGHMVAKGRGDSDVVIDDLRTRVFGYPIESVDDGDGEDTDVHLSYHSIQ